MRFQIIQSALLGATNIEKSLPTPAEHLEPCGAVLRVADRKKINRTKNSRVVKSDVGTLESPQKP